MVGVVVVVLVWLSIQIESEGPDQSVLGRVTRIESHEICVAVLNEEPLCAHVDYPGEVSGIAVGDCVQMKASGSEILESVRSVQVCE